MWIQGSEGAVWIITWQGGEQFAAVSPLSSFSLTSAFSFVPSFYLKMLFQLIVFANSFVLLLRSIHSNNINSDITNYFGRQELRIVNLDQF